MIHNFPNNDNIILIVNSAIVIQYFFFFDSVIRYYLIIYNFYSTFMKKGFNSCFKFFIYHSNIF